MSALIREIRFLFHTDSEPESLAMTNLFVFMLVLFSTLWPFATHAQSNANDANKWRLVKRTWAMVGDPLERYEYKYDGAGRITELKNYRGKSLILTEKDFVYNNLGQITRYKMVFSDSDPYSHVLTYDQQNRLKSHEEIRHRASSGKDQITLTQNYSYSNNQIIERKIRSSFGGKLIDETTYSPDSKGNFTRKTGIDLNSNVKAQDYIYGNYDNKPNPLIFTGAYFMTVPQSLYAGGEGEWEGNPAAISSFTHNKDSLLSKMIISYTTSDGGKVKHTHEYTYVKLKL